MTESLELLPGRNEGEIPEDMNMKMPFTQKSAAIALDMRAEIGTQGSLALPKHHESNCVQLDDFLQIEVLQRPTVRSGVQTFLKEHYGEASGISFIAARGKLIAELLGHSGTRMTFGDLVAKTQTALDKSELRSFNGLEARELARSLCIPAVDLC